MRSIRTRAIRASTSARASPRRTGDSALVVAVARQGRHLSLERAGEPHRGRIADAEKAYVREHGQLGYETDPTYNHA